MIKLITICLVLIASSSVGNAKKGINARQVKVLDDTKFPPGSKVGFTCKKVQPPMARKSKKSISMSSTTIMKMTKISISGELTFHLSCTRNAAGDKGEDVVPIGEVDTIPSGRPEPEMQAGSGLPEGAAPFAAEGEPSTTAAGSDAPLAEGEPSTPAAEGETQSTASTAEGEPSPTPAEGASESPAPDGSVTPEPSGGDDSVEARSKGKKDNGKKKAAKG